MNESREHIRNRMLQNAAKIWGYSETEDASNFDPLVGLLLSVNATEMERLSNEIYHSRNRVMERIVQLLAPDVLTAPHLASAILNANTLEDVATLSPKEQFYITQNIQTGEEAFKNRDIFFTPTDAFTINRCNVKYAVTGNKIYRYNGGITKEVVAIAREGAALPNATIWIAVDKPDINLANTQFYFQYRSEVNKDVFYKQLKNTAWSCNGKSINTQAGYNSIANADADWFAEQIIEQKNSATAKYMRLVNELYEENFITIREQNLHGQNQLPPEIRASFEEGIKNIDQEDLRWIKISFAESITNTMLEDVSIFSNCFPVVNRKLHNITYRIQEMTNVIPLLTGNDQFFDIAEITDENGRPLHIRDNNEDEHNKMSILMRNGGAGRFDERDATVVIENLVQLLRDESASFSKSGKDLIAQEVKTLQQSITKVENMVGNAHHQTSFTPYLMVRNQKYAHSKYLYIQYWSTNGFDANGLRPGTRFQPYKTGSINHSSVMLLTSTQGGKNRLSQSDSVLAYKYALLSKDRVMSTEDIHLYCRMFVGKIMRNISVKKGFMISAETTKGFMKTIDVFITINRKDYLELQEKNEVEGMQKTLALQLAKRSMAFIPFRVFINEEAL